MYCYICIILLNVCTQSKFMYQQKFMYQPKHNTCFDKWQYNVSAVKQKREKTQCRKKCRCKLKKQTFIRAHMSRLHDNSRTVQVVANTKVFVTMYLGLVYKNDAHRDL